MDDPNCLFCKIVKGEIPAKVLFENDLVVAFHDIAPQAPVHVLVIPKAHMENVLDVADHGADLHTALWEGVRKAAELTGVAKTGFRTVMNTGVHGGQTVDHLHIHVLGERQMGWPPG